MWVAGAPFLTFLAFFLCPETRASELPIKQPKSVAGLDNTQACATISAV